MYNKWNSVVIVLTTDQGWISLLDGEIINTHDQNPLESYQSAGKEFDVLQIQEVLEYKSVIEVIDYFFECQVGTKTPAPMKTKSQKRKQRRALAKTQQNLAKKQLAKEAQQVEPILTQPEVIEPEVIIPEVKIIAPGPMNVVKSNNVKSKVMKSTKKVVRVSRIGVAKGVNLGVDILYFGAQVTADIINYTGSKLVKAISNCEESVGELMDNRTEMVNECEDAILKSPELLKAYTSNAFINIRKEREERKAKVQTMSAS